MVATAAASGLTANVPRRTRNSPTKPRQAGQARRWRSVKKPKIAA